jgi:outer membrane immunogenic protein
MRLGAVIRGIALAAVASFPSVLSAPASAADMPIGPRPVEVSGYIPAPYFWTGYYVGLAVGYGSGSAPFVDPFHAGTSASVPIKGFLTGGVTGINYQIGWAVVGLEGDFLGSWVKGSTPDSAANSLSTDVVWTASLTPRFGVAFDRVLVYAKGGGAFDYDRSTVNFKAGGSALGTTNHAGWTVGGGVEYAFTEHWTTRIEYDYFKFASKSFLLSGTPTTPLAGSVGLNLNQIKAVFSYKM